MYQTTITYTTSPKYNIENLSSTDISDVETEMYTEKTDDNSIEYVTSEMTTMLLSTLELTTMNASFVTESSTDSTSPNTIYWTTEHTSEVTLIPGPDFTGKTSTESDPSITSTTLSTSTSDPLYKTTTDYNPVVTDTTLSNSFFTDYPVVKTNTESTVDTQDSTMSTETTTQYMIPTTAESDHTIEHTITTIEPKTPACLNKVCQNGGTCLPTPEGPKVRFIFIYL